MRDAVSQIRFESVFAQASFQFCGHSDEFLIRHTRHLCLMYCQPRFGKHHHTLRRYESGKLVEEREIRSSQGRFAYYWLWLWHHNVELWRFARRQEGPTLVVSGHPVLCFGMSLMRRLCKVRYSYHAGDYFPPTGFVIRTYERVKKFYHDRADFAFYLTDAINRKMNGGTVRKDARHQTVMWGLKPFADCQAVRTNSKRILFVGLMRSGQGIDRLLQFVADHAEYSLALVGVAANGYEQEIRRLIDASDMGSRVYFENRFHSEGELREIAKTCFCGVALYDMSADNFTHYADPGKVKAYMEFGLSVVMSRISEIVPFVERFKAGHIVDSVDGLDVALNEIAAHADEYGKGVAAFNAYFDYEPYYAEGYRAWEGVWS